MTRFARIAFGLTVSLVCGAALLSGCAGSTKAGTKYSITTSRELEARVPADLPVVHDKAVEVLRKNYQFSVTREAKDATQGVVEAVTARNDKVSVETFKVANGQTRVKVWFGEGAFGSTGKAQQVLEAIEDSLGIKAAPTPPTATVSGEKTK